MNIEQIEKMLAEIGANLVEADFAAKIEAKGGVAASVALPVLQCQLFLHIYYKLKDIEEQGQTKPGAW